MGSFPFSPLQVNPYAAEPLQSGEALYARYANNSTISLASGQVAFTFWTAVKSESCSHVSTQTEGTAASGLTYAAVGIYTIDQSGNLTLAASTGDLHASLWTSIFTSYTSALTTPFVKTAGSRYALAVLAVGTTPPVLSGVVPSSFAFVAPLAGAALTGQSSLPSSVPAGSLVSGPTGTLMPQAIVAP